MLNECPISSFKFSLKFFTMQMQLHLRSHSKWEKGMVLHHALSNNFITIQAKKLKDSNVLLNKFYSPFSKDNFFFFFLHWFFPYKYLWISFSEADGTTELPFGTSGGRQERSFLLIISGLPGCLITQPTRMSN